MSLGVRRRSKGAPTHTGRISSWTAFASALNEAIEAQRLNKSAGLRILTERVTSPTLSAQLRSLLAELPFARWHQYDLLLALTCGPAHASRSAGTSMSAMPWTARTSSFHSMRISSAPGPRTPHHTRRFADRRRPADGSPMKFFMHLARSRDRTQVVAGAGILWLLILITFTLGDALTRGWIPQPSGW